MSDVILFLGTGTGANVTGKGIRSSGGIIIKSGDNQFLIDPGISAIQKSIEFGVNLRENTGVLVSHAHLNHANDVNAVIETMTLNGLDRKGVLLANQTSITGNEEYSPIISTYHRKLVERVFSVNRNQRIGINDVEVNGITARHNDPNSIGYKIITPNVVITYTGDTVYAPDIIEQYKYTDILIMNVPSKSKCQFNLNSEDAVNIINEVKPKIAILSHFSHDMIKADPLYEAREIQKQTKIQTIAANDGMAINTRSFEGKLRHRDINFKENKFSEDKNYEDRI